MTSKIMQGTIANKKNAFDVVELQKHLNVTRQADWRDSSFRKKTTFSPSVIGGFYGRCFSYDTEFVTDRGIKKLGECSGEKVVVWSGYNGWKQATVQSFGFQNIVELHVSKNGVKKVISTTAEHRWIVEYDNQKKKNRDVKHIETTSTLRKGDKLWTSDGPSLIKKVALSPDGIRAGFVYGDGHIDVSTPRSGASVRLFGGKDLALAQYFQEYRMTDVEVLSGHNVPSRRVSGLPRMYKSAPSYNESASYLYGWLAGYFAADGNIHESGSASISSASLESIAVIKDVCAMLGLSTGAVSTSNRLGINGEFSLIHTIGINIRRLTRDFFLHESHKKHYDTLIAKVPRRPAKWVVDEVRLTSRIEEVYCVVEPETETFSLSDGILTKNCSRYWYYAFNGAYFEEKFKPQSAAAMNNGTSSHERIQKTYEHSDVDAIIEKELKLDDPPIRGFADVIVTLDGVTAVGDIKTINASGYNYVENSMKPKPAHTLQVLIYMKILDLEHGFLHYENKDTHEELFIPVTMNARLSTYVDEVFAWMRDVAANKELPKRCFAKAAPECKYCPLSKACWKDEEGVVDLPKLKVIKQ